MNLLGIHLTMLIGPVVPGPAPVSLSESLEEVEVRFDDEKPSGFQIRFQIGRTGPMDLVDYGLLNSPLLRPHSRVVLILTLNATPRVLMDGIITHQQLAPSNEPGASKLTVTGEDMGVKMNLQEKVETYPAMNSAAIATLIISRYAQYGVIPLVIPAVTDLPPSPTESIPAQSGDTDLVYLRKLAHRHGYVFYLIPGPAPTTSLAYWGPPERLGLPQSALSANQGHATNLEAISFSHDGLSASTFSTRIQDRTTNVQLPVQSVATTRVPLSTQPALVTNLMNSRERVLSDPLGTNFVEAMALVQAETDRSTDQVITATGELDSLKYGNLLQARGLVGVRGVGYNYNGIYYVKTVTHKISKGSYKQSFTLTRDGLGSTTPLVRP